MKCIFEWTIQGECQGNFNAPEKYVCLRCINAHSLGLCFQIADFISKHSMLRPTDTVILIDMFQALINTRLLTRQWFKRYEPEEYEAMLEQDKKYEEELKKRWEKLTGKNLTYRA